MLKMELVTDVINNQLFLYFPVALVLVGVILVFTFGFKSAEQPPFLKLASTLGDDKKTSAKKRKTKEKKAVVNGSAVSLTEGKSTKDRSTSNKEAQPLTPKSNKNKEPEKKKVEVQKPNKPNGLEDQNNKKNVKPKVNTKPVDYDEGDWETVPIKNDKKTKKQDSPKKTKKPKKADNLTTKEEENKENLTKLVQELIVKEEAKEQVPVVEEKKVKDKEVKSEEVVVEPPEAISKIEGNANEAKVVAEVKKPNVEGSGFAESNLQSGVAFDELGDVWTDTKQVKKSKKKSRRDN